MIHQRSVEFSIAHAVESSWKILSMAVNESEPTEPGCVHNWFSHLKKVQMQKKSFTNEKRVHDEPEVKHSVVQHVCKSVRLQQVPDRRTFRSVLFDNCESCKTLPILHSQKLHSLHHRERSAPKTLDESLSKTAIFRFDLIRKHMF